MTENVSEPMRLRIASRASCILSLRSSESVSLIYLPCECYDLALTAVGIAQFYLDRRPWRERADRHALRHKGCPVIALRSGGICGLSYYNAYTVLHARPEDEKFLFLRLIADLLQCGRSDVHLGCERANCAQPPACDDVAAEIVRHLHPAEDSPLQEDGVVTGVFGFCESCHSGDAGRRYRSPTRARVPFQRIGILCAQQAISTRLCCQHRDAGRREVH